jgi:hypothetical protein
MVGKSNALGEDAGLRTEDVNTLSTHRMLDAGSKNTGIRYLRNATARMSFRGERWGEARAPQTVHPCEFISAR